MKKSLKRPQLTSFEAVIANINNSNQESSIDWSDSKADILADEAREQWLSDKSDDNKDDDK